MERFTTDIEGKDISLYMPNGFDADYIKGYVLWSIDFEMRTWGVKSIEISVYEVKISYIETNMDTDEETEKEMVITENIKIEEPSEFGTIYPQQLEISTDGKCTVEF